MAGRSLAYKVRTGGPRRKPAGRGFAISTPRGRFAYARSGQPLAYNRGESVYKTRNHIGVRGNFAPAAGYGIAAGGLVAAGAAGYAGRRAYLKRKGGKTLASKRSGQPLSAAQRRQRQNAARSKRRR